MILSFNIFIGIVLFFGWGGLKCCILLIKNKVMRYKFNKVYRGFFIDLGIMNGFFVFLYYKLIVMIVGI